MMHRRAYTVRRVESAEILAGLLTEFTWCGCNGFEHAGFLFLNDATSPDGAQEYGVVSIDDDGRDADTGAGWVSGTQVESVTFSWCSEERALEIIEDIKEGRWGIRLPVRVALEPEDRHRCPLCA